MPHKKWWLLGVLIAALVMLAGCQQSPAAPGKLSITGPESGVPNQRYSFAAAVEPITTTVPLTYQWEVTGATPISSTSGLTHTAEFTWDKPGMYDVTVTASNAAGKTSQSYKFLVAMPLPDDSTAATRTILKQQKDAKTSHIDLGLKLNLKLNGLKTQDAQSAQALNLFKNFKASATLSGDVDNDKNAFQLQGELDLGALTPLIANGEDTLKFEVIMVGNKIYSKAASDTEWHVQDAPDTKSGSTAGNVLGPELLANLLQDTLKADKLADEKIDGVDTYHYKVTLDMVEFIDAVNNLSGVTGSSRLDPQQLAEAKKLFADSVFEIEMWVGKLDLLNRQAKAHINLNLTNIPDQPGATALIDLTLDTKSSKINEPVNITAPK
jgi:PKD repeat protein